MLKSVKHLVISGGALKGVAFLGVLECLQRRAHLNIPTLKTIAGSSVGAMIACLLCVGFSTVELFQIIIDTNFAALANIEITKLLTHFGLDSGHLLVDKMRKFFSIKGYDPDITFASLYEATGIRLVVTVTCLGKGVKYFDHITQPDLSVLSAVRMSFAIPFLFTAVKYKDDYYVDGGLLDNVPMSIFADEPPNSVIVIRTSFAHPSDDSCNIPINSPEDYFWMLLKTTLTEIERLRLKSVRTLHTMSTICIPSDEIETKSAVAITLEEKQKLFKAGYRAAWNYLSSDVRLTLNIQSLPEKLQLKIWKEVHKSRFETVLSAIAKG